MGSPEKPSSDRESVVESGVSTPTWRDPRRECFHKGDAVFVGTALVCANCGKELKWVQASQLDSLNAENAELRVALERIAAIGPSTHAVAGDAHWAMREIARAALAKLTQPSLKPTVSKSPTGSASENEPTVTKEKGGL